MDAQLSVGTRCCVPRLPDPVVHRPRLVELLADGTRCPVTLVSGPPGAGKTTLLAGWVRSLTDRPAAWLTLHSHDDQPGRLPELVVEALSRAGALGDAWTGAGVGVGEALLDAAFEHLMARDGSCVLVLEDVQEVRSADALHTLSYLVDRSPAGLDLVLSTRADPPIGWGRVWLDGRLGQIRYADLAFDEGETAALVAAHGVELSRADVATLVGRTEGWAAGLRLAVGALQAEPDPHRFVAEAAATQATVADYLLGEVLMRQDQGVQEFLLRTSIVDRLTPELAQELSGDDDAGERLRDLAQRGLFLTEVEDHTGYRYHPLFRALLHAHLHQRDAELAVTLHRRAAAWHLERDLRREAEHHALAARDWPEVGRIVLQRWLDGGAHEGDPLAEDVVAAVPAAAVVSSAPLALLAAVQACRDARREDADLYRAALDELDADADALADAPAGTQVDEVGATARLLLNLGYGWTFGADDRMRAALTALRERATTEPATPRLRQLATLAHAEQAFDDGALDEARRLLQGLADEGPPAWHRTLAAALVALIDAAAGAIGAAEARLAAVDDLLGGREAQPTTHVARMASALCAAQRGSHRAVAEALAACDRPMVWPSRSLRHVERALRAAAAGRAPYFVSLDHETARHPLAERALVALGVMQVVDTQGRLALVGGDGERVVLHARQQLGESSDGVLNGAARGVTDWLDQATSWHPRTVVEARVLATMAADQQDDRAAARRQLGEALELAAATGITAPLLAYGRHVRRVLDTHREHLGDNAGEVLEILDRLQRPEGPDLIEGLTDREIQVLQHLPTLMSNAEIAAGLHLSVNTVKTHLKAVYRKLGVDGRRDAMLRGRQLELL